MVLCKKSRTIHQNMGFYHGASVVASSPKAQKSQAVNDLVRDIIGYGVKEQSKNPQRQEIRQSDTSGRE
jgi:hypothetical protein